MDLNEATQKNLSQLHLSRKKLFLIKNMWCEKSSRDDAQRSGKNDLFEKDLKRTNQCISQFYK